MKKLKYLLLIICGAVILYSFTSKWDKYFYKWEQFHIAAYHGDTDVLRKLLSVDERNDKGLTALETAIIAQQYFSAETLIRFNADVNLKNHKGVTPLMIASRLDDTKIIELLINNNAKVNDSDNDGWTPLMYAIDYRKPYIIEVLIEHNAEINFCDKLNGNTPLILAVINAEYYTVEILINAGADVNIKNIEGKTASDINYEKNIKHTTVFKRIDSLLNK